MVTYIRGKRAKARFPLQEKKELSAFQYRKADQWDAEGADTKNVGQRWTIASSLTANTYEEQGVNLFFSQKRNQPRQNAEFGE